MRTWTILPILLVVVGCAASPRPVEPPTVATFSIVARDPETGDLGVAVQSKFFFGVGAVVPWAKADVGAVATQAWANTTYGPRGLDLMEGGVAPTEIIQRLTKEDVGRQRRQVGMVDARGRAASYTGKGALAWAGHVIGDGFACQGNILAGEAVVAEMARAFKETMAPFPERLVAALAAGQAAGGDKRGRQSAALLVVRKQGGYSGFNDRWIDVRVDDHDKPIEELGRLLALHRRVFGTPPLPGKLGEFKMEEEPDAPSLKSPRAAYLAWGARFLAGDFEALYAAHSKAFRTANPFEAWVKEMKQSAEAIESFLDRATYAGTRIRGDRAQVALNLPGSPRPHVLELVKEEGEWRFTE